MKQAAVAMACFKKCSKFRVDGSETASRLLPPLQFFFYRISTPWPAPHRLLGSVGRNTGNNEGAKDIVYKKLKYYRYEFL